MILEESYMRKFVLTLGFEDHKPQGKKGKKGTGEKGDTHNRARSRAESQGSRVFFLNTILCCLNGFACLAHTHAHRPALWLPVVHEIGRGAGPITIAARRRSRRPATVASPQERARALAVHAWLV